MKRFLCGHGIALLPISTEMEGWDHEACPGERAIDISEYYRAGERVYNSQEAYDCYPAGQYIVISNCRKAL